MPDVPAKFQTFLDRLKGVREHKPGLSWSACCPAHADERPSLSVNIGESGNLVITCHSPSHGCTPAAIMKSVGLTMGQLFLTDKPGFERKGYTRRPKPDNVYQYQYEDGRLAYETCRYNNPKDFSQRRPNPKWRPGGDAPRYLWNLEGVRFVLYRLPKLLAELDAKPDRWVTLVEGEKCSDTLEALGILATTHALGADHWRREYATDGPLKGKRVAIFYDLDPYNEKSKKRPGPAWAVQAARDLYAAGCQVRICFPPGGTPGTKYDVADYVLANLNKGANVLKRELFDVISRTADYFPGWENMTAYESLQWSHRQRLAQSGPGDMNAVMLTTHRRLVAAMDGVSLDSLPSDMAELAAWCQWLTELLSPRLKVVNIILTDEKPPQNSEPAEPEGTSDEPQEAASEENPAQALCIPAQIKADPIPRGEDGEPEAI
jgi:hypothetical protein